MCALFRSGVHADSVPRGRSLLLLVCIQQLVFHNAWQPPPAFPADTRRVVPAPQDEEAKAPQALHQSLAAQRGGGPAEALDGDLGQTGHPEHQFHRQDRHVDDAEGVPRALAPLQAAPHPEQGPQAAEGS